jgi:hypothetical protein
MFHLCYWEKWTNSDRLNQKGYTAWELITNYLDKAADFKDIVGCY